MCKKEDEKKELQRIDLEDLEKVTGGSGAFENVPRVPSKPIDEPLKGKI